MLTSDRQVQVYRPLGLSIAIFGAMMVFGVFSILKFYVAWRLNRGVVEDDLIFGALLPFDALTQITALLGGAVILTAMLAWWGRPPAMRWIFQGVVLLSAVALVGETIYRTLISDDSTYQLYGQGDAVRSSLMCQVPLQILTALYIIWYCNRAPARAFYRQEPMKPWSPDESTSKDTTKDTTL